MPSLIIAKQLIADAEELSAAPYAIPTAINNSFVASVFAAMVAIWAAVANVIGRAGLSDSELAPSAKLLALSLCILFAPSAVYQIGHLLRNKRVQRWGDAHILLAAIGILASFGLLAQCGVESYAVFVAVSACCGLLVIGRAKAIFAHISSVRGVILAALSGIVVCIWALSQQALHPLLFEELVIQRAPRDPVFDAVLVNMVKSYGISTTGYDGITFFHYHVGSHWLLGAWSSLLHVEPLTICGKAPLIVLFPLMLKSLLALTSDLSSELRTTRQRQLNLAASGYWLILVIGIINFVPLRVASSIGMAWATPVLNMSFMSSLAFMFLTTSVVVDGARNARLNSPRTALLARLTFLIVMPLLLFGLGLTKQSALYLMITALLFLFVRLKLFLRPIFLGGAIATMLLAYVAFRTMFSTAISPRHNFAFYATYVDSNYYAISIFPILYYFWILAAFFALLWTSRKQSAEEHRATNSRRWVVFQALVCMTIAAQIPPNIWDIHGGSGTYFLEPPQLFGLAMFLALTPELLTPRRLMKKPLRFGLITACLVAVYICSEKTYQCAEVAWSVYLSNRTELTSGGAKLRQFQAEVAEFNQAIRSLNFTKIIHTWHSVAEHSRLKTADLELDARYKTLTLIRTLNQRSAQEKRRTLVYIPRCQEGFWGILPCDQSPMLIPALSGFAALAGLPPAGCTSAVSHGFCEYPPRSEGDPAYSEAKPLTAKQILKLAALRGFRRVLVSRPGFPPNPVTSFSVLLEASDSVSAASDR